METTVENTKGLAKQEDKLKTYAQTTMKGAMPAPKIAPSATGMLRTAGLSKQAYFDSTTQPTFWYSPELTPDSYLLPKSRVETLRFCQIYYNLDPYVNACINLHTQYAFSPFTLQYKDPNITELFNKLLTYNQDFDWYQFTLDVALSYFKYGEACLTGDTRIIVLDSDNQQKEVTIKELYDTKATNFKVVSFEQKGMSEAFSIKTADKVLLTRKNAAIVKITLNNGDTIRCTPDHLFLLHNHDYRMACNLEIGDALCSMAAIYTVASVEQAEHEDVYDIHSVEDTHNFAIAPGIIVHNCVWGDWDAARRTWRRFTLLNPAIVDYKEDMMTGHATIELIPTNEMKKVVKDAIIQGRRDIDPLLLDAIENNKKLPLDTEGIPENVFTGQEYIPPKVFMFQRKTDPSSERGTSMITCLMKDLIYKDQLRLSQLAVAQKTQLPIELWTVGHIGNDDASSMLPGPELLEEVRQMITQATQQPPFSIVYGPYLKYEALGVSGKLLDIYNDLGYVENQILVGMNVNKAVILGEGPSVQGKAISLNRLIRFYQVTRDLFANWFKRNILLPIAKANHLVDENGQYIIPNLIWSLSLEPEEDKERFDLFYKMWKDGLISTMTLFEHCPEKVDYNLEMKRLVEERLTPFCKGDRRLAGPDGKPVSSGSKSALDTASEKGVEAGKGNEALRDFALGGEDSAELEGLDTEVGSSTEQPAETPTEGA